MNQFWRILANFLEQQTGFANGRAIHPFYFGLLGFCYALLSNGEFFLHMPQPSEKSSGKPQSTRPPETFSETVAIKIHKERPWLGMGPKWWWLGQGWQGESRYERRMVFAACFVLFLRVHMTVFLCFASWFGCVSLFFFLPRWVVFLIALKRVCEAGAQKWHFLGEFWWTDGTPSAECSNLKGPSVQPPGHDGNGFLRLVGRVVVKDGSRRGGNSEGLHKRNAPTQRTRLKERQGPREEIG